MGETQQYCLKWNNYQTSLSSSFKDLLANEKFVDCTLTCGLAGGQTIHAHRVVLSACSPYFRQVSLFRKHNIVIHNPLPHNPTGIKLKLLNTINL